MMTPLNKELLLAIALLLFSISAEARADFVTVNELSDIVLWAGDGGQEAGFVLQFGDGEDPTTIAWGYRWDGAATVQDMMVAVAGSTTISGGGPVPPGEDSRLSVSGAQFDFGGGPVVFISSITYNQNGLPPEWSQVSRAIVDDWINTGTYPSLYSNAGAGGIWTGATMNFAAASVGISELVMVDGGWYGFVQSNGSDPFAFTQPVSAVAVPEPGTWGLGIGAIMIAFGLHRRMSVRTP
jgi:hypothetical protein